MINIEISPKIRVRIVFPAALKTPVSENCTPITPNDNADILKNVVPIAITS